MDGSLARHHARVKGLVVESAIVIDCREMSIFGRDLSHWVRYVALGVRL